MTSRGGTAPDAPAGSALSRRELAEAILVHLDGLGLTAETSKNGHRPDKAAIRALHGPHREERAQRVRKALRGKESQLLTRFATGRQVRPAAISPRLVPVPSDGPDAELFRFATLLWSVPVSTGFGRRMRFLVIDESNEKLIGVMGLTDPVFNLAARDQWIGWDVDGRRERLVNVMDAFVLGAVPPYSSLLGGKLVATLVASREVGDVFDSRYGSRQGKISGRSKDPKLALVTVTSALGRSSLYNRLRLRAPAAAPQKAPLLVEAIILGETQGYGHFQLTDALFGQLRDLLRSENHAYADGNRFGQGPNWRMRVIRAGLAELGIDPNRMRHGVAREVIAIPRATNAVRYLAGDDPTPDMRTPGVEELGAAARERWIVPRAQRRPAYRTISRDDLRSEFQLG